MSFQKTSFCRFGVFELDLRAAELHKNGVKLRLQDQPYQVLLKLIEHHGEVVSREELRSTLWDGDTFVDFETGLNTAIKRLRETLGDSADNPTFIETIPRKGYKFIAPVERPLSQDGKVPDPSDRQQTQRGKELLKRRAVPAAVGVLLLCGVAGAFHYSQPKPPTVTNVVRITNDGKAKIPTNSPATDGVRLYFVEGEPWTTGSGIAQVSATGGETTWIATTLRQPLAISAVSPDHSELLVPNGVGTVGPDAVTEFWVQPLPAGAAHRFGNIKMSSADWVPDGIHIVYAVGHAIMIANKDGSEPHRMAEVPGVPRAFRFSPVADGSVFTLFRTRQSPARYGKWTRAERTFIRFFRIGKSRHTSAAETGRRAAITIIFRRATGARRPSGFWRRAVPSFTEAECVLRV